MEYTISLRSSSNDSVVSPSPTYLSADWLCDRVQRGTSIIVETVVELENADRRVATPPRDHRRFEPDYLPTLDRNSDNSLAGAYTLINDPACDHSACAV